MEFFKKSRWIWTTDKVEMTEPVFVLFRHTFTLSEEQTLDISVSADSCYELFVNGRRIANGPCRGSQTEWYYDTVPAKGQKGENCIAARVLHYPADSTKNPGVWRTAKPGLWMKVERTTSEGMCLIDETSEDWKCKVEEGHRLFATDPADILMLSEELPENRVVGWEQVGFDDSSWTHAFARTEFTTSRIPSNLEERPIPQQFYEEAKFDGVVCVREGILTESAWQEAIHGGTLQIPAGTKEIVELETAKEVTGYIHVGFEGGAGSRVSILTSECYCYPEAAGNSYGEDCPVYAHKAKRSDYEDGTLLGRTDIIPVTGQKEVFETFFYRAFRYVRIEISTAEEPLTIEGLGYRNTGYPLEVKTQIQTSDETLNQVWDMSLQTLRLCMQDTYMDCPFYEQLQYIQDTRQEALFTYAVSGDDRMARRAMADFAAGQCPSGMMYCAYPSLDSRLIPGFSLYFVNMVHDHMMYFADADLVKRYLPNIMKIFRFFENQIDARGLVKPLSEGAFGDPYWDFVDWAGTWEAGCPDAVSSGSLTLYALQLCLAYEDGADLAAFVGYTDMAEEWHKKAEDLRRAVREYCLDKDGIPMDGADFPAYSQHTLSLAVLAGVVTDNQKVMHFALEEEQVTKCTVSYMFHLFRALEKADMYEYTDSLWDIWRQMVKDDLTTCAETDQDARSDCHAWSALALYEIPAVILGVRPQKPGFRDFQPSPVRGKLAWAKGSVITPIGQIESEVNYVG